MKKTKNAIILIRDKKNSGALVEYSDSICRAFCDDHDLSVKLVLTVIDRTDDEAADIILKFIDLRQDTDSPYRYLVTDLFSSLSSDGAKCLELCTELKQRGITVFTADDVEIQY